MSAKGLRLQSGWPTSWVNGTGGAPLGRYARVHVDSVRIGDRPVGTSTLCGYTVNTRSWLSVAFLDAEDAPIRELGRRLALLGDSLVVVGGDGLWNIHVHVDDVGAAIEERELADEGWDRGDPDTRRTFDERVPDILAEWQDRWPHLPALWTLAWM